ncbi:DNA-binding response OmpR family regulator [Microbacterium sp. AG1240]|uniref:response regulator transcription factor n=1 Tax=Microbacterium sp. AG1240 TaxID=2183992 RepID=UPI000EB24D4D|nr:response regulator transcription factor [Microbacterium sp. AG1240]RKT33301.1 DNA-binding response OmpR family regulator [Microbacterium sp. AG1240]
MRILIVDDERAFADVLAIGLTAEGFAVDSVHDGRTGYLMAATGAYSAIVLDLMLPQLSGYAVCARLRAEGVTTPVIVLTAKNGEYDEVEALQSGADDYLRKPFSYPVLVARIHSLLRRPAALAESVLTVGDLVIDASRRRVRRGGTPVELGAREWSILEVLARAAGTVVSKEALLGEAWPDAADDVNLVEARVSVLRRKIDAPFDRHSLVTVRGAGYRLIDDRAEAERHPGWHG